mmetsp:Transcript_22803/g.60064  ORF Transcript_22803/g.60064 Transcript_22803/m.60064 type:complete len:215 (+) Transcript_22803:699-1343(+)
MHLSGFNLSLHVVQQFFQIYSFFQHVIERDLVHHAVLCRQPALDVVERLSHRSELALHLFFAVEFVLKLAQSVRHFSRLRFDNWLLAGKMFTFLRTIIFLLVVTVLRITTFLAGRLHIPGLSQVADLCPLCCFAEMPFRTFQRLLLIIRKTLTFDTRHVQRILCVPKGGLRVFRDVHRLNRHVVRHLRSGLCRLRCFGSIVRVGSALRIITCDI